MNFGVSMQQHVWKKYKVKKLLFLHGKCEVFFLVPAVQWSIALSHLWFIKKYYLAEIYLKIQLLQDNIWPVKHG